MDREGQLKQIEERQKKFYLIIQLVGNLAMLMSVLFVLVLLSSCATPDIIEQAKNAEIRHLREACMNRAVQSNLPSPSIRASMIHQCHAWARRKVY